MAVQAFVPVAKDRLENGRGRQDLALPSHVQRKLGSLCESIEDSLVRVLFRAQEDEVLESMRSSASCIVEDSLVTGQDGAEMRD